MDPGTGEKRTSQTHSEQGKQTVKFMSQSESCTPAPRPPSETETGKTLMLLMAAHGSGALVCGSGAQW